MLLFGRVGYRAQGISDPLKLIMPSTKRQYGLLLRVLLTLSN